MGCCIRNECCHKSTENINSHSIEQLDVVKKFHAGDGIQAYETSKFKTLGIIN